MIADGSVIDAPLSLSNVLTVALAIICLWTSASQSSGGVLRQWCLAVPPCLAAAVALVLLVGVLNVSVGRDAEWVASAILGAVFGRTRGWSMHVDADRRHGLFRLPKASDGVIAAFGIVVLAMLDFAAAAREEPLIEPNYVAAAAALCAGYLGFRAVSLIVQAVRAPHVELLETKSAH